MILNIDNAEENMHTRNEMNCLSHVTLKKLADAYFCVLYNERKVDPQLLVCVLKSCNNLIHHIKYILPHKAAVLNITLIHYNKTK